jgi:hypothetical protein
MSTIFDQLQNPYQGAIQLSFLPSMMTFYKYNGGLPGSKLYMLLFQDHSGSWCVDLDNQKQYIFPPSTYIVSDEFNDQIL